jgi:hypothetical protein
MRYLGALAAGLALLIAGTTAPRAHADAQFTVAAAGPSSLQAGLSGTYVVTALNDGDPAPVQLFIVFAGKLQQFGQISAEGGFDCTANENTVRCTTPRLPSHVRTEIVVQGRGSEPGAGQLVVNINPDGSVPELTPLGGGTDNFAQKNVTIT